MHCEFAGGVSCRSEDQMQEKSKKVEDWILGKKSSCGSEDQMQGKRSPRRSGTGFLAREAPASHKIMCVIGSLSEIDWKIDSDMAVRQIASESISRSIEGKAIDWLIDW